jgi:DNA-binding NarL/FixJ family response regulator
MRVRPRCDQLGELPELLWTLRWLHAQPSGSGVDVTSLHIQAFQQLFAKLGAAAWAHRARRELRASGLTARKRDLSTIDELTPQELQIARFVAEGLSNKEVAAQLFLSPRTIDHHLRSVFAKLGITSRGQLARLPLGDAAAADEPAAVTRT